MPDEQRPAEDAVGKRPDASAPDASAPAAHRHAEDARLMRELIDSLPLTIYWKARDLRYLGSNRRFAQWAGLSSGQSIVNRTDDELAWAVDAEKFQEEDRRIIQTGTPLSTYGEPRVSPEGKTVFVRRRKVPLRDERGAIIGIAGFSERLDAGGGGPRGNGDPDASLRVITENAAQAAVVVQDGRVVFANARGRELLDRSPAAAPSLEDLVHPDDRQRVMEDYREMFAGGGVEPAGLYRLRALDGEGRVHWLHASTTLVTWNARPASLHFIVDVTAVRRQRQLQEALDRADADRRRAEGESALLYTAIEQAAEYVLITDAGGTITYVNPAFERVTGYAREEALGKNPRMLRSGAQDPSFYEEMWRTLATGGVWHGRLVNRRRDGSTYSEEGSISPVKDEAGRTVSYVAVKRDVTRALELEESLRQAQKMEAVGRLAGGVAHDFNNILTTITGYADLLLTGLGAQDPRATEVREILDAARRASVLTRQLLTFSRKQVTAPRLVNLNTLIENTRTLLRPLIGEDVELVLDLEPGLWPIFADTGQMERVILNLSVNARDAMPKGGTLTFRTRNGAGRPGSAGRPVGAGPGGSPAGDHVLLVVRDTGTGMDREVRSHLFEPFFTTKKPGEGTGLGLATVYGIVEQSRGSIEVASEPGKGTEFRLRFPRQDGTAQGEEGSPQRADIPQGRETILLVEDENGVRSLTRVLLSGWGYSVLEAADPREAISIAERAAGSIDLLLTDVVMPGMRGSELAARVSPLCRAVLFMSGYPDDAGLGIGKLGSGVHFLAKPFTPESLARKVREALGGP